MSSYDGSIIQTYTNKRDYIIYFTHVPTDRQVSFPAFLTSFQDNFTSDWESTSVFGRMDQIFTYKQTTRSISFGITIPCLDLKDSKIKTDALRTLTKFLYPTYIDITNATTIKKAPLMRIKFANFISSNDDGEDAKGLLGVVKNIKIEPDVQSGFFDPEDGLYPKAYKLDVPFDVIHETYPGNPANMPEPEVKTERPQPTSFDAELAGAPGSRGNAPLTPNNPPSPEVQKDPNFGEQFINSIKTLGGYK